MAYKIKKSFMFMVGFGEYIFMPTFSCQASESGSVEELQSQLLEWQENVPESEESRDRVREEKSAMALRMAQIEEEREGGLLFLVKLSHTYDVRSQLICLCVLLQTEFILFYHD